MITSFNRKPCSVRFFVVAVVCWLPMGCSLQAAVRETVWLDAGWQFKQGEVAGAQSVNFDDLRWSTVSIPHSWGWEEAQKGDTNYYRGPGWYRRELGAVTPQPGRRFFLRFEAAATVAEVYLNGQLLGEHRGGFGAFCFEISTNLSSSGTNLIAVRVSNAPQPDIAPLSADFNVYGGLYRRVCLIETGEANFALTDHASPGVAWLQSSVSSSHAVLEVTAQISNGTKKWQTLDFATKIVTAEGHEIALTNQTIKLAPETTAPYWAHLTVAKPHLWNGRKDPYLYKAIVELRTPEGEVDKVVEPLGLRFYKVDPDLGFFLNGRPYPIHGVCRHQDRQNKGWAISAADMEEDVQLIKEMGAAAVRCAHYEHNDYFYSLCDRAGLLVWAEIPQVDKIDAAAQFSETSRNQLLDLIRQNINHPSIFAWSLFNELGNGKTPDPERELQDLNNVAHSEDPTRPTIGATCTDRIPQMDKIPDLLGWNTYPGWYSTNISKESVGAWLDKERFVSRNGGLCLSEYGAGANVTQHEENPHQPTTNGQWHPEEWQMIVHENVWGAIKTHPFVWGGFLWNMFDFCVASRHEGDQIGLNDKGLVTYDRKIKKDAFYFYQANWSADPVLYITSRRFVERTNAMTNVKIYSNAEKVELFVNGVSQGKQKPEANAMFVWKNTRLRAGENRIEARALSHGKLLKDNCAWKLSQSTNLTK